MTVQGSFQVHRSTANPQALPVQMFGYTIRFVLKLSIRTGVAVEREKENVFQLVARLQDPTSKPRCATLKHVSQ
jgi:hypothetical protein